MIMVDVVLDCLAVRTAALYDTSCGEPWSVLSLSMLVSLTVAHILKALLKVYLTPDVCEEIGVTCIAKVFFLGPFADFIDALDVIHELVGAGCETESNFHLRMRFTIISGLEL